MDSVQIIQRHAFERTQAVGLALARASTAEGDAQAVTAGGFHNTFREALLLALSAGRSWTVMIDGDVLLLPGAIARGVDLAERYPADHFVVSACVHDKLMGAVRVGGVRFYRTELIAHALTLDGWQDAIRPESTLIRRMAESGSPSASTALLAGVHDFEQYLSDLFRTAVVHATKFSKRLEVNLPRWRRLAVHDPDFAVVVAGVEHGLATGETSLDRRDHLGPAARALDRLGLPEKDELSASSEVDPAGLLLPGMGALRTSTPLLRLLPELSLRIAPAPGQPRRARRARLLLKNRRFLSDRSAIPLRRLL